MTKKARIYNGEKTDSSINAVGKIGQPHAKELKLDNFLIPCTKINSKWLEEFKM